jgi:hypothetical protein
MDMVINWSICWHMYPICLQISITVAPFHYAHTHTILIISSLHLRIGVRPHIILSLCIISYGISIIIIDWLASCYMVPRMIIWQCYVPPFHVMHLNYIHIIGTHNIIDNESPNGDMIVTHYFSHNSHQHLNSVKS